MSNASQVLSLLSITAAGFIVYETGGIFFTATADGIHAAHVADVTVGGHPYAAVTTCHTTAPQVSPLSERVAEHIGVDPKVLADWVEWCEDVVDDAVAECSFEGHGGDTDELHGPPDSLLVRAQMQYTWEVPASAADSVALVNAA